MFLKKKILIFSVVFIIIVGPLYFIKRTVYPAPADVPKVAELPPVQWLDSTTAVLGNNWLRKNKYGNWESYVEGPAYQRGLILGALHQKLIKSQEEAFVNEIETKVPNSFFRKLLQYGISWFNRDLDEQIPKEFQHEIYGISKSFADTFNYIGPKYNRVLNYHAAHDIGHMAQNMNLVACSAAAQWQFTDSTAKMLVGRNFDFYFGDEFAANKIVLFCNPDKGIPFVSVTWGGFCGVVSGMNQNGLTVTLNALPSEVPTSSSTPVSIIAREILQYATTIDEALTIVEKYDVFVSESFTVVSAADKRAAVIEKTPEKTAIFYPENNQLLVTNHFQSDVYKNAQINLEHLENSESAYRYQRLQELLPATGKMPSPTDMAAVLRDKNGLNNEQIGYGNPMAINQLLAHHAVIFNPLEKVAYISENPYQENFFTAYSVANIAKLARVNPQQSVAIDSLQIAPDEFYNSMEYKSLRAYRKHKAALQFKIENSQISAVNSAALNTLIQLNPGYYEAYKIVGDYYFAAGKKEEARQYYKEALAREIPYQSDRDAILEKLNEEWCAELE